jgi:hypothetical protein
MAVEAIAGEVQGKGSVHVRPGRDRAWWAGTDEPARRRRFRSALVQASRDRVRILEWRFRLWAHRFILVGYLLSAVGAWMLVRQPARSGFVWLAVGATLQLIGGLLQH